MKYLDNLAYINDLKDIHPAEKMLLALLTMMICILSQNIIVPVIIIFFMAYLCIFKAKIPFKFYFYLMILPFSFISLGLLSILISVSLDRSGLISIKILNYYFSITEEGFNLSLLIFFRSFGAVSCLYFLALTTPIIDIMAILRKCKVPEVYLELMTLIYRVIFILIEIVGRIYNSQSARLGYANIGNQYRSLGMLISNLFTHAYNKTNYLFTALESRGYNGTLNVLEKAYTLNKRQIAYIILVDLSLILMGVISTGIFH